jgi:hypothetical protein
MGATSSMKIDHFVWTQVHGNAVGGYMPGLTNIIVSDPQAVASVYVRG